MRLNIFRKGTRLVNKVVEEGSLKNKAWFSFKDIDDPPSIVLANNGKYTYLEACTCTHHSVHGGLPEVNMKNLCSYVLAVYKYLGK